MGSKSRKLLGLSLVGVICLASLAFAVGRASVPAGLKGGGQRRPPHYQRLSSPVGPASVPGGLRRGEPRRPPDYQRLSGQVGRASVPAGLRRGEPRRPRRSAPVRLAGYQSRGAAGRLVAHWLGQDQHDFVGPHSRLEKSEVQDVHIVLSGLDPRREVVFVEVNGHGGDQWQYADRPACWKAELRHQNGSRSADLFIEPSRVETGRPFHIVVRYEDGSTAETEMLGRTADPRLRMPGYALGARWLGQDGQDWTGPGPCVGPDGLQDVRIHLTKLSARSPVRAIRIECSSGSRWEFGTNPKLLGNAELVRDEKDRTEADLYFQPDCDTNAERIKVRVLYENDQQDDVTIVAGRCDSRLRMPESPLPKLFESPAAVEWLGQDGAHADRPGDVHVAISGLTPSQSIDGAVLSDAMRRTWILRAFDRAPASNEPGTQSITLKLDPDGKSAHLFFPPYREAGGEPFFLRLISSSGRSELVRFKGQRCEIGRRSPMPAPSRAVARPGDDLQALANAHGTISLSPGIYRLNRPLVLNHPVTVTSDGSATLQFAQSDTDSRWSAAIKIHRGNTTLNGFAVRFEAPIRWNNDISWGPAVIGMTDNLDPGQDEFKPNIVLTHLDVEVPPVESGGRWVEAVRLMRLLRAASGVVANSILRGGPIEFFEGPWRIVEQ